MLACGCDDQNTVILTVLNFDARILPISKTKDYMSEKITTESLNERFKITPEKLDQAIQVLVKLYNPLKIYLFGSYVHGRADISNDVDLFIVIPEFTSEPWKMTSNGYGALESVLMPIDLILYDQKKFEENKAITTSLCSHILKTGKLLYEKS